MKCEQRDCGSNVNGWCQFEAEGDERPSSCTAPCSCSVCGKVPDTDTGAYSRTVNVFVGQGLILTGLRE